jgi:DNA-directed RNA polymerase subunit beta'
VDAGQALAESDKEGPVPIVAQLSGTVELEPAKRGHLATIAVVAEEREEREYRVPPQVRINVEDQQVVSAGEQITEGAKDPQEILSIQGREAVQRYLVDEIQAVYRGQGVTINDKHIEVIVRQMLRKLRVDEPGDTSLLRDELVDRFEYEEINREVLAEGGEPATAHPVLLGVTKASLSTESFLAAASFQETTRVLTDAALMGKVDHLMGLKENVIIGKLIPAGSGLVARLEARRERQLAQEAVAAFLDTSGFEDRDITGPTLLLEDVEGLVPEDEGSEPVSDLDSSADGAELSEEEPSDVGSEE